MKQTQILRQLLAQGKLLVKPSAYDALSARIIERAGFPIMGVTGYGISSAMLGKPDVGLVTLTEAVNAARYISGAVDIPIICDADTGFGNAINVMRTTEEFIKSGAAGFHMEDQVAPKRCGHVAGKETISTEEAVGKIRAADHVRRELDPDFLIIARTDVRGAVDGGMDAVIQRGRAFADAGADMVFPDGLISREELERCVKEIPVPIHYNMSVVGISFYLTLGELEAMGVAIVSNPGGPLRAAVKAVWDYVHGFAEGGTDFMIKSDKEFEVHPTGDMHKFFGFPEIRKLEEKYLPEAAVEKKYRDSIGYQP
jgi:2-methylisocitrate lyase-like PEP mutase family enzyme